MYKRFLNSQVVTIVYLTTLCSLSWADVGFLRPAGPHELSITERSLLSTFKQNNIRFIETALTQLEQPEQLTVKTIFVPLSGTESASYFSALANKPLHYIFLTSLVKPNTHFQDFLRQQGLIDTQNTILKQPLPLYFKGSKLNTSLNPGVTVFQGKSTSNLSETYSWNQLYPVVISNAAVTVLNWPANLPIRVPLLQTLLKTDQERLQKEPVVSKPQEAVIEEKNTPESYPEKLYEFTGEVESAADNQSLAAEFYNDHMRELGDLQDGVQSLIAQYSLSPKKQEPLQGLLQKVQAQKSAFESAWWQQDYKKAMQAFQTAKQLLSHGLLDISSDTQVEGRAIWLDRGTIVEAKNPEGLKKVIKRIVEAGFNIIYFETFNAGYPIYPSQLTTQNPQIVNWDPLKTAVDEAHRLGVELHAWVWCFAVGNMRHNTLLNQAASYTGPILSKTELSSEALKSRSGDLAPVGQHEYWLSPASQKGRDFLISLYSEIVKNYAVDGLQLDYIRYPFQKPGTRMGFENQSLSRFEAETGLKVKDSGEEYLKAWTAWKAYQVSTFVKAIHDTLKAQNPKLTLSAAVFPLARNSRMSAIQQDWETWLKNGWLDTLSPMTYSRSPRSLSHFVDYVHTASNDKVLVYPGISLIKRTGLDLLETLEVARKSGVMGTTVFAARQFDASKEALLSSGPYHNKPVQVPHHDSLEASLLQITEVDRAIEAALKSSPSELHLQFLNQLKGNLGALVQALHTTTQQEVGSEKDRMHAALAALQSNSIEDLAKAISGEASAWPQNVNSPVERYQAEMIGHMAERAARLAHFSYYQQLAAKAH
jgi:uncharacterized lipoprotein YddW (UPF0748 family)